jgi:hypothetical protein
MISRDTINLGWAVGGAIATAAFFFAFRWLGIVLVFGGVFLMVCRPHLRTEEFSAALLAGFLICSHLPIDISFQSRAGLPKVLPICYGKPNRKLLEQAKRGEVVLGGCCVRGYDPLWVIVW